MFSSAFSVHLIFAPPAETGSICIQSVAWSGESVVSIFTHLFSSLSTIVRVRLPIMGAGIETESLVSCTSFSLSSCEGSCPASCSFCFMTGLSAALSSTGLNVSRFASFWYICSHVACGTIFTSLSYFAILLMLFFFVLASLRPLSEDSVGIACQSVINPVGQLLILSVSYNKGRRALYCPAIPHVSMCGTFVWKDAYFIHVEGLFLHSASTSRSDSFIYPVLAAIAVVCA